MYTLPVLHSKQVKQIQKKLWQIFFSIVGAWLQYPFEYMEINDRLWILEGQAGKLWDTTKGTAYVRILYCN
jgi:hypothetical protein